MPSVADIGPVMRELYGVDDLHRTDCGWCRAGQKLQIVLHISCVL